MYQILLFSGGVYKFDTLEEYVEDVGGLILREDRLHISRGEYFISAELQVLIIIPRDEIEEIKTITQDIRGNIEELELEKSRELEFFNYLHIFHLLSNTPRWKNPSDLQNIECYPIHGLQHDLDQCSLEKLEKILEDMVQLDILKSRENNGLKEYCIHVDE